MDPPKRVKTRVLFLSDTHACDPKLEQQTSYAYRWPLPEADVAIHTGDLTLTGKVHEHEKAVNLLKKLRADIKIVIPGNHDLTLDTAYYAKQGHIYGPRPKYADDQLQEIRKLYTGPAAQAANILYIEEGVRTMRLQNGASLTVYASAYTPEFCGWAFAYPHAQDRFNTTEAANPLPSFNLDSNTEPRNIDIVLTHGPPFGILDQVRDGRNVGCEHLRRAVSRAKPLVHCFGHIHEAWGAIRKKWPSPVTENTGQTLSPLFSSSSAWSRTVAGEEPLMTEERKNKIEMGAHVDATDLVRGSETLFVNASIMNLSYAPEQAPWIVDLMLDRAE